MKHFYACLCLLFLTISPSFGQKDFKPGYIIQNGDTLRGLVNHQGDKRQAVLATFKASKDASEQNFSPVAISGYGIDEVYAYESKKITAPDSTFHLFLTVLAKGPASLYFYKDQNSADHFFIEKDGALQELVYRKASEVQANGQTAVVTYNTYRKTLFNAFRDCPTAGATVNKLAFKESELIKIVNQYNQCVAPVDMPSYQAKARRSVITYGVHVGGHKNQLTVTSDQPDYKIPSNIGYQAGVMLNATLPWASEKVSALLELQYAHTTYNYQGSFDHNNAHTEYTTEGAYHQIKLPVSIRYTFPRGTLRPFFNAGLVGTYALSQKQRYTGSFKYSYSQVPENFDKELFPFVRKFTKGYALGTGLLFPAWGTKKATIEARYEKNDGNSDTISMASEISQVSVYLGLFF
ncbi:porin family protein [Nibribacter koreensis]|uniref:Outer membrane protein beta-barrel domain-containing protein n=1 Tax=Nibribacter koreensis TaxID=1084519 RepID=A0ABP8FGD7_9BACT